MGVRNVPRGQTRQHLVGSSEDFGFTLRGEPWSPDLLQTLTGCLRPQAEKGLWAGAPTHAGHLEGAAQSTSLLRPCSGILDPDFCSRRGIQR